jgi:hypothetical protein
MMSDMKSPHAPAGDGSQAPAPISLGGHVILYSQYTLIALLVLGALVLRLAFGAP